MDTLEQLYCIVGKLETIKEKNVKIEDLSFITQFLNENPIFQAEDESIYENEYYPTESNNHSEYSGTYAHDVAGLSDDFIGSVLGGEPEAYWNID